MKTLTVWREGSNIGSKFKDGNKILEWANLSKAEKIDFVHILREFADFFERFI